MDTKNKTVKKKKIAKRSAKASPSFASNASGRSRLDWDLIGRVDLKYQSMETAEEQIEKIMRQEMIVAGNVKIVSTTDGQTKAGWKLRRI